MTPLAVPRPPVTITVYGRPTPQGSKRATAYVPKGGGRPRAAMREQTGKHLVPWREDVRAAAERARQLGTCTCDGPSGATRAHPDWCGTAAPLSGPLAVSMVFALRRPKSHYRTGRNYLLLKDSAPYWPHGIPDLSKLARSTEDALVSAGLIADDSLIAVYDRLAKTWAGTSYLIGGNVYGLREPGAVITIRQLT